MDTSPVFLRNFLNWANTLNPNPLQEKAFSSFSRKIKMKKKRPATESSKKKRLATDETQSEWTDFREKLTSSCIVPQIGRQMTPRTDNDPIHDLLPKFDGKTPLFNQIVRWHYAMQAFEAKTVDGDTHYMVNLVQNLPCSFNLPEPVPGPPTTWTIGEWTEVSRLVAQDMSQQLHDWFTADRGDIQGAFEGGMLFPSYRQKLLKDNGRLQDALFQVATESWDLLAENKLPEQRALEVVSIFTVPTKPVQDEEKELGKHGRIFQQVLKNVIRTIRVDLDRMNEPYKEWLKNV